MRYRVTGLAAEAAFFGILSLPPLVFGLVGAIGFIVGTLDIRTIAGFREQLLDLSSRALTSDVVNTVIEPTLDDVLSRGRAAVISIGFLLALWAGSRALNVFVDTITIMYGMAGKRGLVRTRALVFCPLLGLPYRRGRGASADSGGAHPGEPGAIGRPGLHWAPLLAFRVAGIGMHARDALSPVGSGSYALEGRLAGRSHHRGDVGRRQLLLRFVLSKSIGSTTIYGPLAAPIAFLIWLYLISMAVLIGAAFNSAMDDAFPRLSGIDHGAPGVEKPASTSNQGSPLRRTLAGVRAWRRGKSQ